MKAVAVSILLVLSCILLGSSTPDPSSAVIRDWTQEHLRVISTTLPFLSPPAIARSLAVVNSCIFDALGAYVPTWKSAYCSVEKRPLEERTLDNMNKTVAMAAFKCIKFIFAARSAALGPTVAKLVSYGLNPDDVSTDTSTPAGVANFVHTSISQVFLTDGFNQDGLASGTPTSLTGVPFSDYTNYKPKNDPQETNYRTDCSKLRSMNHWQPLRFLDAQGQSATQTYLAPFLGRVQPFALRSSSQLRPPPPPLFGTNTEQEYVRQSEQVLSISAALTDRQKVIAEYWADGPGSYSPPGHWHSIALRLTSERGLNLLDAVKLLFLQSNAVFDAGLACWETKRYYDSVRPITALQCLKSGQSVAQWCGPYEGTCIRDGSLWLPYQASTFPTPPFSEYVSGHSTFSAAAAEVLKRFFGSDAYDYSDTIPAGSSVFEPRITDITHPKYVAGKTDVPNSGPGTPGYTPAQDVTLNWPTFSAAAEEAGISRLYGGIHIEAGNLGGTLLGRKVGEIVWNKYTSLVSPGLIFTPDGGLEIAAGAETTVAAAADYSLADVRNSALAGGVIGSVSAIVFAIVVSLAVWYFAIPSSKLPKKTVEGPVTQASSMSHLAAVAEVEIESRV